MFSIIVPVRDKPHTIARTLDGLFAQAFAEFEAVLVGDPADESLAIAARSGDPRLRIIHQANCGQGAARNAGIEASRGDWIAFLDADDFWLPDHLLELHAIRSAFPEAGLIGTNFLDSDMSGRFEVPRNPRATIGHIDYFDAVGRGGNVLFTSSAAIPRTVFDRIGGFGNTHFGEDSEYWARIALAYPVAASTRPTVVYVHGTGGITESGRDRWLSASLASLGDISPAVRRATDAYPTVELARTRRGLDRYIRRYIHWCLRAAVVQRDLPTIRRLRHLYWGRPSALHLILLAIGGLPGGLARALYAAGFRLRDLVRAARRQLANGRPR